MILVNGRPGDLVSVNDRGFLYGDGVFETCRVVRNRCQFWSLHMDRLYLGCDRLGIEAPNRDTLEAERDRLLRTRPVQSPAESVLKIVITRGINDRGYQLPAHPVTTRVMQLTPFSGYPDAYHSQGLSLRLCTQRLSLNPQLAGIKHLNRLEQVLARAEWEGLDEFQEGLMLDSEGHVVEGTMSNVFVLKDGGLKTPTLEQAGVAGVIRRWLLESAPTFGLDVSEETVTLDDVMEADAMFMSNSLLGVCPVRRFEGRVFDIPGWAGEVHEAWEKAQ